MSEADLMDIQTASEYYWYKVQLPLLAVLTLVIWLAVGLRVWNVWKNMGWRTCHGVSTVFVVIAAVLCTAYLCLVAVSKRGRHA